MPKPTKSPRSCTRRFNLRLPENLRRKLNALASAQDLTDSQLVRKWIRESKVAS